MPEFTFSLIVDGLNVDTDADVEAFFNAGCDDATLQRRGDMSVATFYRTAGDAREALCSAIRDVDGSTKSARVVEIDPDLVSTADIAHRIEASPETVRTWTGARPLQNASPFPPPIGVIGQGTAVWRWSDIAQWLHANKPDVVTDLTLPADLVARVNATLVSHRPSSAEAGGPPAYRLDTTLGSVAGRGSAPYLMAA